MLKNIISIKIIFLGLIYIIFTCQVELDSNMLYLLFLLIDVMITILGLRIFFIVQNFTPKRIHEMLSSLLENTLIVISILVTLLAVKVYLSLLSEIYYNSFLSLRITKIRWTQSELFTVYYMYSEDTGLKIEKSVLLKILKVIKTPEDLRDYLDWVNNFRSLYYMKWAFSDIWSVHRFYAYPIWLIFLHNMLVTFAP